MKDTWGKTIWEPTQQPYRAMLTLRDGTQGLHGWSSYVLGTFATEAEARAAVDKPFPARTMYGQVHFAKNGSWQLVYKRLPIILHNAHVREFNRAKRLQNV